MDESRYRIDPWVLPEAVSNVALIDCQLGSAPAPPELKISLAEPGKRGDQLETPRYNTVPRVDPTTSKTLLTEASEGCAGLPVTLALTVPPAMLAR